MTARDEGVIKFECRWLIGEAPEESSISDLIKFRNRLFELNLIGVYPDGIGFGNISKRLHASSSKFVISASQTGHLPTLDAGGFSAVTAYDIKKNWVACCGPLKASSESLTHAMIYDLFEQVDAVIHVHHHAAWKRLQGKIPTSAVHVAYGTPAMAQEVARLAQEEDLPAKRIFVMAGHEDGILSFGPTLSEAFDVLIENLNPDLPS